MTVGERIFKGIDDVKTGSPVGPALTRLVFLEEKEVRYRGKPWRAGEMATYPPERPQRKPTQPTRGSRTSSRRLARR